MQSRSISPGMILLGPSAALVKAVEPGYKRATYQAKPWNFVAQEWQEGAETYYAKDLESLAEVEKDLGRWLTLARTYQAVEVFRQAQHVIDRLDLPFASPRRDPVVPSSMVRASFVGSLDAMVEALGAVGPVPIPTAEVKITSQHLVDWGRALHVRPASLRLPMPLTDEVARLYYPALIERAGEAHDGHVKIQQAVRQVERGIRDGYTGSHRQRLEQWKSAEHRERIREALDDHGLPESVVSPTITTLDSWEEEYGKIVASLE